MARSAHVHRWVGIVVAAGLLGLAAPGCSGGSGSEGATSGDEASTTPASSGGEAGRADEVAAPMAVDGRWLVDGDGRVVQIRGINEVYKSEPFYPAADDFGPDDAAFLAEHGFNAVRLGVDLQGLMPEPGEISEEYLDGLATSVEDLEAEGVLVLLDFHQDGYSPKYNGNGFPDWMAIDDGLENPDDAVFPLYYVQNPAMQRAWESFWENREGPGGVGVQDRFLEGVAATAERFAEAPNVIGYEAINESFPGAEWQGCYSAEGCPDLERERMAPFAARFEATVRDHTDDQLVWVEPFVTFNFGAGPTTLAGPEGDRLLAVHSYALTEDGTQGVIDHAVAARDRDDKPVLITEFGARNDRALLDRLIQGFDEAMLPWMFWAYNENLITEREVPAAREGVDSLDALEALVRPYPQAVAGTPEAFSFDLERRTFELTYATEAPSGQRLDADTEVYVPDLHYPDGYEVEVEGAEVTSAPCASVLTLRAEADADRVSVRLVPAEAAQGC